MLKSLLSHWGRAARAARRRATRRRRADADDGADDADADGAPHARALCLHLVVDAGARAFFEARLRGGGDDDGADGDDGGGGGGGAVALPGVGVRYHAFEEACVAPLVGFLREFELPMSSHYSGAAGFCRLFLPDFLAGHYGAPLREPDGGGPDGGGLSLIHI